MVRYEKWMVCLNSTRLTWRDAVPYNRGVDLLLSEMQIEWQTVKYVELNNLGI